jgi:hypothetical protein
MKVYGGEMTCTQVGRPVGRKTLGRPNCRWEDNIKMDQPDVEWKVHGLDRSGPGERQLEGSCDLVNKSLGSIKYGKFFD